MQPTMLPLCQIVTLAVHVQIVVVEFSRGEARRRHNVWNGDAVRTVEERQQNVATNHFQLMSED